MMYTSRDKLIKKRIPPTIQPVLSPWSLELAGKQQNNAVLQATARHA
jgi:hypothetical protein